MRLIGPKEFLKTVKPGTLYQRYWLDSAEECMDLIGRYKNKQDLYYWSELEMFGDNGGSLAFLECDDPEPATINGKTYNCLFYYDANVVGDAGPNTTLYLVYDSEDEWPDRIQVRDTEDEHLDKEELLAIRDWFLSENHFKDETKGWALEKLETDEYYKDDPIVNYRGE